MLQFNISSPTRNSSHRTAHLSLMLCSCLLVMCPAPWQPAVILDTLTTCTTMQKVRPHNWIHKHVQVLSYQNRCIILTFKGYESWFSHYIVVIVSSYKYSKRWQLTNDTENNLCFSGCSPLPKKKKKLLHAYSVKVWFNFSYPNPILICPGTACPNYWGSGCRVTAE